MSNKEQRAYLFDIETRNDEKHGDIITGVPIVFNQRTDLGLWDEVIDEGALDSTDLKDVRFLVNHDTDQIPLARSRNNNENSTMQLEVKEDGLHVRVDLDTENNQRAKELYSAIKRQDVTGMSFMFTVDGDSWEELDSEHPTRHINSISKVFEVSAVTFPAYEQTSISARSLESGKESLANAKHALESARALEEKRNAMLCRLEVFND